MESHFYYWGFSLLKFLLSLFTKDCSIFRNCDASLFHFFPFSSDIFIFISLVTCNKRKPWLLLEVTYSEPFTSLELKSVNIVFIHCLNLSKYTFLCSSKNCWVLLLGLDKSRWNELRNARGKSVKLLPS